MNELPPTDTAPARNRSIDVIRGVAILWVVIYHLHGFMTTGYLFAPPRRVFYEAFADRLGEGDPWSSFTAFTDLVFAMGSDGVTIFLMLSGLSLTMLAMRRDEEMGLGSFYRRRIRRLLVPYWVGWAMFIATLFVLAVVRTQADGGDFWHNFQFFGPYGQISWRQAIDGLLLFPRGFSAIGFGAIPPSLWFVFVLLQYYLLFPLAYAIMMRTGPWAWSAATLLLTFVATYWFVSVLNADGSRGFIWGAWWPFHPFDFAFGMALGYWLVRRPPWLDAIVARWPLVLLTGAAALGIHTVGGTLDTTRYVAWSMVYPLQVFGLGMIALLVAAVRPGRVLSSSPARLLALVGVISYTVLIVNDCMRLVNHSYVIQGYGYSVAWWIFVTVIYVPVTVLIAYPLASLLGLLPTPLAAEGPPTATTASASDAPA